MIMHREEGIACARTSGRQPCDLSAKMRGIDGIIGSQILDRRAPGPAGLWSTLTADFNTPGRGSAGPSVSSRLGCAGRNRPTSLRRLSCHNGRNHAAPAVVGSGWSRLQRASVLPMRSLEIWLWKIAFSPSFVLDIWAKPFGSSIYPLIKLNFRVLSMHLVQFSILK
jgi:hypothetical protein